MCFIILYGMDFRLRTLSVAGVWTPSLVPQPPLGSHPLPSILSPPSQPHHPPLSPPAFCEEDINLWITGLNWLVADTQKAQTPLQIER